MSNDMTTNELQYLKAIFDRSADGLMIADRDGVILKLNRACERLNGIDAADVVGKDVISLMNEGRIDRSATREVLESGRQVSVIQRSPHSDHTLLVTGTPVFDDKGDIKFVVVNERDISLIETMQQELASARQTSEKFRDEVMRLTLLELEENDIVAQSDTMKDTVRLALKLAGIDASNILIQGESGTGKGLLAKFIHTHGPRKERPLIQINCAALPENLLEAELFGYVKGAFTGADEKGKPGLFELASQGTLFLDEIGEMSLNVQAKLLKYLDDHEITPVGGTTFKKIDCAIIAATNRDLERLTRKRAFRLDLFHRLNTFTLSIPPLRERPEDILDLVRITLKKYNKKYHRRAYIDHKGFQALQSHDFPGNVRELFNIVKQAVVLCDRRHLDDYIIQSIGSARTQSIHTPSTKARSNFRRRPPLPSQSASFSSDHELAGTLQERLRLVEVQMLQEAAMCCDTTRQAATFLGISQPSVVRKFKQHGIQIKR